MKPIFPKPSGATPVQGIFTSPRTTIILAPPPPPSAGPKTNAPILPNLPSFTITLAPHRVSQPSPIVLPLTRKPASSSSVQPHCAPIAPKTSTLMFLKEPQSSTTSSASKGHKIFVHSEKKGNVKRNQKYSKFETPILPNVHQPGPQTVILLPYSEKVPAELPSLALVPQRSAVMAGGAALPHTPLRDKRQSQINKTVRNGKEKLNMNIPQTKQLQNKTSQRERCKNARKPKAALSKLPKNNNVDTQIREANEINEISPSHADRKDEKETSESITSPHIPESLILSVPDSLDQSPNNIVTHHQDDMPYHPPPPYHQGKVADEGDSPITDSSPKASSGSHACGDHQKESSDLSAGHIILVHEKREKYDSENNSDIRSAAADEAPTEMTTLSTDLDFRSYSCSNNSTNSNDIDEDGNESNKHIALLPPPTTAARNTQTLSNITLAVNPGTTPSSSVANSSPSFSSSTTSPPSRIRDSPFSTSHTSHKIYPPSEYFAASISSSTTQDESQTSLSTPVDSTQKTLRGSSHLSQPNSSDISVSGSGFSSLFSVPSISSVSLSSSSVSTISSASTGVTMVSSLSSSVQSVSHTSHSSSTPTVSHVSQSPAVYSLCSDAHEASSTISPSNDLSCQPKFVDGRIISSRVSHLNQSEAQSTCSPHLSPHLDIRNIAQSPTIPRDCPQSISSLPSVLESHLSDTSTETSLKNLSSSASSHDEMVEQRVCSYSSLHSDSPQQNPHSQHPSSCMESSHMTSLTSTQTQTQSSLMHSLQHPPSYRQSSQSPLPSSSSFLTSGEKALSLESHHFTSCIDAIPSAVHSQGIHNGNTKSPYTSQSLNSEQQRQASYIHSTLSSPQQADPTRNQQISSAFHSSDTPSLHSSPQLQSPHIPSFTSENVQANPGQNVQGSSLSSPFHSMSSPFHSSLHTQLHHLPSPTVEHVKDNPCQNSLTSPFHSTDLPFHPTPQTQPPQMSSVTVEQTLALEACKDSSESPVPPPYNTADVVSSSQYYADSEGILYFPEKAATSTLHSSDFSNMGKLRPSSSSTSTSFGTSNATLGRSLSPPSYESHLQSSSYVAASSDIPQMQHCSHHHNASPMNYSFSSQTIHGQRSELLNKDAKGDINSNGSSSDSPLVSLLPPPKYNYRQELTHEEPHIDNSLIADMTRGTINYDLEESSETYFPSTASDTHPLPLLHESQSPHSQAPEGTVEYRVSSSDVNVPAVSHDSSDGHSRQQDSQGRLLLYPFAKQDASCRTSDQDDFVLANWSSLAQSTEHGDNLRVEKLWFLAHQEQHTHVGVKEAAKYLPPPADQGLQSTKTIMLKKFWIEEDEPLAEEIIASLVHRSQQPAEQVPQEQRASPLHPLYPQYPTLKKYKTRQLLCQICGKMLKGPVSLRYHLNSHYNIQPHVCPTCDKRFTTRSTLAEHLRIHTGELPYLCTICSRAFRTRSGFANHRRSHSTARPFECSVCSKRLKTKFILRQHMKLHVTGAFKCSECGKTFERHKSLAVHKAYHHHKSQRFKCPHCHKGYHFRSLLNHHMLLHSNIQKHVCSICRRSFVWRSGLVAHMRTHSTSRPTCDVCGACFASERRLESHYNRHIIPKPHQCKICGKSFSHANRLASHSITHRKHRHYRCSNCDIIFTNAKKFRKHLVTHKDKES